MVSKITTILKIFIIDFAFWIPLLLLFIIIVLYFIYKHPIKINIKIHNFYRTYALTIFYVLVYIIFFLGLRIYGLGKNVDLYDLILKCQSLLFTKQDLPLALKIAHYLMLIIIVFCWLLLVLKLKQYLEFQIYKVYFYHRNKKYLLKKISTPIDDFISKYFWDYCFSHFISKLIWFFYKRFPKYFQYNEKTFDTVPKYIKWGIIIVFYSLVLHECITNNFVLHNTFYYLIIYILLRLWIRLDNVQFATGSFASILMERAYKEPEILYVNLTPQEESHLLHFIKNPSEGMDLVEFKKWFIVEVCTIEYYRRFELLDKENSPEPEETLYYNRYLKLGFYERDVERRDGKNFVKEEIEE